LKIGNDLFTIDAANHKTHRTVTLIEPDAEGFWLLEPGNYEISCMEHVEVGPDEMGLIVTRSTLNRNAVKVDACVFDSGYHGELALRLEVMNGPMKIQRGTRIAQYVCYKSEVLKQYNGSYGFGTEDDAKYGSKVKP
jgi:deoxycytidine triphosphate deaminase